MMIPLGEFLSLNDNLKELLEYSVALSKLLQSNAEKNSCLAQLRTDESNLHIQFNITDNDIKNIEKQNIDLKQEIQHRLDKQKHEELKNIRKNQTGTARDSALRNEIEHLAEFLRLDLNAISAKKKKIKLTFLDSQRTTLVFEKCQGELKFASMSPSHPKFEQIQRQLQETGDLFVMIVSMSKHLFSDS